MKPANFPARRNERRVRALQRLQSQPDGRRGCTTTQAQRNSLADQVALLLDHNACNIRTKKDRSARAKLAR